MHLPGTSANLPARGADSGGGMLRARRGCESGNREEEKDCIALAHRFYNLPLVIQLQHLRNNSPLWQRNPVKVPVRDTFAKGVKGGIGAGIDQLVHKLEGGEIGQVFVGLDSFRRKQWKAAVGERDDVSAPLRTSLHGR